MLIHYVSGLHLEGLQGGSDLTEMRPVAGSGRRNLVDQATGVLQFGYSSGGHTEPLFDGHRAQRHLTRSLGMTSLPAHECPAAQPALNALHRAGHLLGKVEGVQVMVGGG